MTRKQHDNFSKRFLPEWVKANSEVFLEMNGQERQDLLFQLWNSAHDGPALEPLGLKVLEHYKNGPQDFIIIQMPPAHEPNETLFIGFDFGQNHKLVYFYERCLEDDRAISETECVLLGIDLNSPTHQRNNYGVFPGTDLAAFKRHLSQVLNLSLGGVGGHPLSSAQAGTSGNLSDENRWPTPTQDSSFFEKVIIVGALFPIVMLVVSFISKSPAFWKFLSFLPGLISVVIVVMLLLWIYEILNQRKSQGSLSPGVAMVVSILPLVNLVGLPFSLWRVQKAVSEKLKGSLVLAWGVLWSYFSLVTVLRTLNFYIFANQGKGSISILGFSESIPLGLASVLAPLFFYTSFFANVTTYLLLWYIVRRVNGERRHFSE